jgi:hypothetical protein
MELDTQEEVALLKCMSCIVLNRYLFINGLYDKLLIEMDEQDYDNYLIFLETL